MLIRKHSKYIFLLILNVCSFALELCSQSFCQCKAEKPITICYFSKEDLCERAPRHCFHIFDEFPIFEFHLVPKLENEIYIGNNGAVKVNLEYKRLKYPSTVTEIEDCNCDIFFTGSYPIDTIWNWQNDTMTAFPESTLNEVKKWSELCLNNVAIISQGEATIWGYETRDSFENLGSPVSNLFGNPIFNGPFGAISNFEQTRTRFHGVFTKTPAIETIQFLAVDQNGLPSIVLDKKTNDLVISDIAILNSNMSNGSEIQSNADILALNIIAHAIQIAQGTVTNKFEHFICEGESILLPNGSEATSEGLYIDTLFTIDGCDSILMNYIHVEPLDTSTTEFFTCPNEPIIIDQQSYFSGESGSLAFQRRDMCDSIVLFDVKAYPEIIVEIEDTISINTDGVFKFNYSIPHEYDIRWLDEQYISCSDCPNPILTTQNLSPKKLEVVISDKNGCQLSKSIHVNYNKTPFIPSAFSPNNDGINDLFRFYLPQYLSSSKIKNFSIYNRWGGIIHNQEDIDYLGFQGWDGIDQKVGVYVYQFEVEYPNGETIGFSGDVNLFR